jgi:putative ABC transport system permease protein
MLRSADRGVSESGASKRIRSGLIVAEFELAIALITVAGLLVRSLVRLNSVDSGFQSDSVLLVGVVVEPGRNGGDATELVHALLERVRTLPGVVAAGAGENLMLSATEVRDREIVVEGSSASAEAVARIPTRADSASPGFFRAVGMHLKRGREFSDADRADSQPVVIINESLARHLWPDADPIGRRFKMGGISSENPWLTVVGVVGDVRRQGLDREPPAQFFAPFTQNPSQGAVVAVRTSVEPSILAPSVRAVAREMDKTAVVSAGGTLREALTGSLRMREFNLGLVGTFAAIAMILSGVGIFGLMSYSVACRTREIGIRMAVGAEPGTIVRQFLKEGLQLALAGMIAGALVAAASIRGLSSLLFGVSPFDPVSFLGALALLTLVALLACLVPALRAIRINPVSALRAE